MSETFNMVPAEAKTYVVLGMVLVLLAGLLVLFAYIAYSARNVRYELTPDALCIKGDLYGRRLDFSDLKVAEARRVDLHRDRDLRLKSRRGGTGLPGYKSGWFRLGNGEKVLAYVTDYSRTVYVPTTQGYSLLLSVEHPDRFVNALRSRAG